MVLSLEIRSLAVLGWLALALGGCGSASAPTSEVPTPPPRPSIATLDPFDVFAREPGLGIRLTGSGFLPGAQILLGGEPLATDFLHTSVLQAAIPDGHPSVARAGVLGVEVRNPNGQVSEDKAWFTVEMAPTPQVFQMVSRASGCNDAVSGEFVVLGKYFTTDATVSVDGRPMEILHREQTNVSGTVAGLTAIPSSVTVAVPGPGGGTASLSLSPVCVWD